MDYNFLYISLAAGSLLIILFVIWKYFRRVKKEFYKTGELKRKYYIRNRVLSGKDVFFYRDGKINKEQYWKNGKLEGKITVYYTTGEKYIVSEYINGTLIGDFIVYEKDGSIRRQIKYADGFIEEKNIAHAKTTSEVTFNTPIMTFLEDNEDDIKQFKMLKSEYNQEYRESYQKKNKKLSFLGTIGKLAKTALGIQAYQARKEAKSIKLNAETLYKMALQINRNKNQQLNEAIKEFGKLRLETLTDTLKTFLIMLEDMEQKNKTKEYEILEQVDIKVDTIKEMRNIEMSAMQLTTNTAITAGLGVAATMGVPTAVTTAVCWVGAASTGTAISSLSGAAATNATLAWLGGGSIAAGGGGMAAGATVLATIAYTATGIVAVLSAGIIASVHYSKKLTQVHEYFDEVMIEISKIERSWVVINGLIKRINELYMVTQKLNYRAKELLEYLKPLAVDFDSDNIYYAQVFQNCGLLIKSLSVLAQAPLLDANGKASLYTKQLVTKTRSILNKELIQC